MICLLVLEGLLVCGLCSFYIWRLLQAVSKHRYKLFSVFMAVPTGFVRGLATKQARCLFSRRGFKRRALLAGEQGAPARLIAGALWTALRCDCIAPVCRCFPCRESAQGLFTQ